MSSCNIIVVVEEYLVPLKLIVLGNKSSFNGHPRTSLSWTTVRKAFVYYFDISSSYNILL